MQTILSVAAMRESDRFTIEHSVPSRELMRRAGEGIFRAAGDEWKPPVAVVCGSGNNAGDGYVLALCFAGHGIACDLILLTDRMSEDGAYYAALCREKGVPSHRFAEQPDLSSYGSIADCIFGTGFSGEPQGVFRAAIEEINRCRARGAFVVSADINSGLGGDNGMGEVAVESDLTVSVGAFQPGHFLNRAKDVMKRKVSVDIGIEPRGRAYGLFEAEDARAAFPERKNFSNKSTYGYLALIGGSVPYSGAIRLAAMANAAMRAGAGVVKLAAPESLSPVLAPAILEATLFPLPEENWAIRFDAGRMGELLRGVKTAAFGMGAGRGEGTEKTVAYLLSHFTGTLVLDADGLNALARMTEEDSSILDGAAGDVILTPHTMEFARLLHDKTVGDVLASPIPLAEEYAKRHGVTLLLKGPATVVTDGPQGRTVLVDRGCPGMATAGSGDVLSGILSATAAVCADPLTAAASAAWINGRAGELAQAKYGAVSMLASDTAAEIPAAVREITG
ncbi:MAG: NAD(P)H-hydrate dehydratase [Clostridia bacterium]|nr:NAD(P)H-hydrate dehydratase [Clostridia bacterium]